MMEKTFQMKPIGVIKKKDQSTFIEIYEKFRDALLGLERNSHIIVLMWFHENDTKRKRETLQVHPMGNKANPLTGVFATRSPMRPNPIALFSCNVIGIEGRRIYVKSIDAFDGSPVLDIKPYVPRIDSISRAKGPKFIKPSSQDDEPLGGTS
jgi:tRNA-Thr(GGU) m(6)t(6)A37 methyltransferase TsaA